MPRLWPRVNSRDTIMWSYYGSKCKIAKHYPAPQYGQIIEPFAGAAWYSVLHRLNKVLLNEKDEIIYNIWKWLIEEATAKLLEHNVDFYVGQDIRQISLRSEHRNLVGFCINRGSTAPRNIVQRWSCQVQTKPNWASTVAYQLNRIARQLDEIKHWQIQFGDYRSLPNVEATWFIDPPYQVGGKHYRVNEINYNHLAKWCQKRKGQVIVCENAGARWLPFRKLLKNTGQRKMTTEVIWTNQ